MATDNNAAYASLVELARGSQTQLDLTNITFHDRLEEDEMSVIYLISIHDKQYVMKTFHVYPDELEEDDILFRNELLAYRRLSAQGLCDKGSVCQFYGCATGLDPALNESWLRPFVNDAFRPCAIFLEYIPNLRQINSETYTNERWERATEIQNDILRAGVLQFDIHYNAMVAVDGNSEDRVVWLDFDWAKTYDQDIGETPDAVYQFDQMRKMGLEFEKAQEEGIPPW